MYKYTEAIITNTGNPLNSALKVKVCDVFFQKFQGLMFQSKLNETEGIILIEKSESRHNAAIHMFFMNFDISVIWLDSALVVVDKTIAKKGHPFYAPHMPSQYTLEIHPNRLDEFSIGDKLDIKYV